MIKIIILFKSFFKLGTVIKYFKICFEDQKHSLKSSCYMDSTVFFHVIFIPKGLPLALLGTCHACCAIHVLHNTKNLPFLSINFASCVKTKFFWLKQVIGHAKRCTVVKFSHNEVSIKFFQLSEPVCTKTYFTECPLIIHV